MSADPRRHSFVSWPTLSVHVAKINIIVLGGYINETESCRWSVSRSLHDWQAIALSIFPYYSGGSSCVCTAYIRVCLYCVLCGSLVMLSEAVYFHCDMLLMSHTRYIIYRVVVKAYMTLTDTSDGNTYCASTYSHIKSHSHWIKPCRVCLSCMGKLGCLCDLKRQ